MVAQAHVGELRKVDMKQYAEVISDTYEPRASTARQPVWLRELVWMVVGCWALISVAGCKDLTGSQQLPAGTPSPSFYNTAAGAVGMRNAAFLAFEVAFPTYIVHTGLFTDELQTRQGFSTAQFDPATDQAFMAIDQRLLFEGQAEPTDTDYTNLQGTRTLLTQAIGQLATYDTAAVDTAAANVMRGELYALVGYTEVLLNDFFCSGVPLSTLNFQKDFTYQPSSTTVQVYDSAIAKFNTAISLARDSARVLNMALVGKGRAWLDLGQYDSAAAAVTQVPTDFLYQVTENGMWGGDLCQRDESNLEGLTGLPYVSSGDPRTAGVTPIVNQNVCSTQYTGVLPTKYLTSDGNGDFVIPGIQLVTLASGVEARLIEAEAALRKNETNTWLQTLNTLRATAPIPGTTQQLPPLADPGDSPNDSARVTLLFAERAKWLFLTGTRQGDLRRLMRQYGRPQQKVYPTGRYVIGSSLYGTYVTAPIPSAELVNSKFHGCLSRGA